MEMAKPVVVAPNCWRKLPPLEPAVVIPITCPAALMTGPPESPGSIAASTWMVPDSVSLPPVSSAAVTVWSSAATVPVTAAGLPPRPSALPIAVTGSPTVTVDGSPMTTVLSPDTPWICSRAMSALGSSPMTVAEYADPVPSICTVMLCVP